MALFRHLPADSAVARLLARDAGAWADVRTELLASILEGISLNTVVLIRSFSQDPPDIEPVVVPRPTPRGQAITAPARPIARQSTPGEVAAFLRSTGGSLRTT